jgi:CRISPR system Cascade subunit CasD
MSTLLLRFAAPLQSWGIDSKFDTRNTGRTPSKSGVLGLCGAALGYMRDEDDKLEKLAELNLGVRIDKPGVLMKDFHTAKSDKTAYVTNRYYLSDAVFLVGLEGEEAFLHEIDAAIRAPMFPLFLGRRGCPPEGRVSYGVVSFNLKEALETQMTVADIHASRINVEHKPRIVMDSREGGYSLRDLPRSFSPKHRRYDFRDVCEFEVSLQPFSVAEHDALAELETMP